MILSDFLSIFCLFCSVVTEKVVFASKSLFQPANSVQSTRLLVEIHNTQELNLQGLYVYYFWTSLILDGLLQ